MKTKLLAGLGIFAILARPAAAHCPLCVMGAGAAAGVAYYYGVNSAVLGVFLGAFGIAMGSWLAKLIKKQFIPLQRQVLEVFSFIATVLPLASLFEGFYPFYLSLFGEYGSIFNSTYLVSSFLVGSVIGGAIMVASPAINTWLKQVTSRKIAFQGVIVSLVLLFIAGLVFQFAIK